MVSLQSVRPKMELQHVSVLVSWISAVAKGQCLSFNALEILLIKAQTSVKVVLVSLSVQLCVCNLKVYSVKLGQFAPLFTSLLDLANTPKTLTKKSTKVIACTFMQNACNSK